MNEATTSEQRLKTLRFNRRTQYPNQKTLQSLCLESGSENKMNHPVLDLTASDNPTLSPAYLGYKVDLKSGRMFWRICMDCEGRKAVEAEAHRLRLEVSHGLCAPHFQQRMASVTGDLT